MNRINIYFIADGLRSYLYTQCDKKSKEQQHFRSKRQGVRKRDTKQFKINRMRFSIGIW